MGKKLQLTRVGGGCNLLRRKKCLLIINWVVEFGWCVYMDSYALSLILYFVLSMKIKTRLIYKDAYEIFDWRWSWFIR